MRASEEKGESGLFRWLLGEKFWAQGGILVSIIYFGGQRHDRESGEGQKSLHLRLHLRLLVSYDSKYSADPKSVLQDVLLVWFFLPLCPNIAKARRTNNNFQRRD